MAVTIVPTVLANTEEEFGIKLKRLLAVSDEIQVDIMDGKFVPSQSISLNKIPDVSGWKNKRFEAHLMVENPGAYLQPLAKRGFHRIIMHVETLNERMFKNILAQCKRYSLTPVLALNPETRVQKLLPYLGDVEGVVFLGVHPGFNGAPYLQETAGKIRLFVRECMNNKKITPNKKIILQVDGGMTPETISGVVAAGATRINSGSYVSNAANQKQALQLLQIAASNSTVKTSKPRKSPRKLIKKTKPLSRH